jgi:hypothetical protein
LPINVEVVVRVEDNRHLLPERILALGVHLLTVQLAIPIDEE